MLLGSDYTIGVKGIGPVNTTEIIDSFYDLDGLKRFKQWTDKGTFQDDDVMKREVREYYKQNQGDNFKTQINEEIIAEIEYKMKHKQMVKHWEFPIGFPSHDVMKGYIEPNVDRLQGVELEWKAPDYQNLKKLALNQLNWHPKEIEMTITQTQVKREKGWNVNVQKKLQDYFNKQHKFAKYTSKRILSAIGRIKRRQDRRKPKSK